MRLIDADALERDAYYDDGEFWAYSAAQIEEAPTIENRKTGRWMPDNNNYYEERYICSVCGKSYKVDTCMGKPMWQFCPCGARMEGEEE